MSEASRLRWHKSSFSTGTGQNCVEVADLPAGAAVRDSQHPELGHLSFTTTEWSAFLHAARTGEL
ncbi:DUF397 domain-containing protein [Spiractinospora alimapuensis]|uniref:DUF397 domain-containing protein n=1 Tax=Spiractinospora alimapuensis TaxID=2820884 RepID=UPI001F2537FF|nr:DUF397 domain-containing protein [Spiractinospora alimapuensis]QVQ50102.1 DUF397 domain-containing protein [Spiractinospora alimapuensis]